MSYIYVVNVASRVFFSAPSMAKLAAAVVAALLALAAAEAGVGASQAGREVWLVDRPAVISGLASSSPLMAVKRAGKRLVAVGVRGHILTSDDDGRSWHQRPSPRSVTLTGLQFVDALQGWAVGHGSTVLHTTDGGLTWQVQLDAEQVEQLRTRAARAVPDAPARELPLFAVNFSDASNGIVVGAFGIALRTTDGGRSWTPFGQLLPNPEALHLYAAERVKGRLLLAGEQGIVLRSAEQGELRFERVTLPKPASVFAVAQFDAGAVLATGLRGALWRSQDEGATWVELESPLAVSSSSINAESADEILIASQSGVLLASRDRGRTFRVLDIPRRAPVASVLRTQSALVAAGLAGVYAVPIPER